MKIFQLRSRCLRMALGKMVTPVNKTSKISMRYLLSSGCLLRSPKYKITNKRERLSEKRLSQKTEKSTSSRDIVSLFLTSILKTRRTNKNVLVKTNP